MSNHPKNTWIKKAQKYSAMYCAIAVPGSFIIWILGDFSVISFAHYHGIGFILFLTGFLSGALNAYLIDYQKNNQ
ncbi:MAG: hypothetical protein PVF58_19585 [Candidatus Methanofastidiosia archaeon]|jgi:hypothetical protein